MEVLKRQIEEYIIVKEDLKKITDRKKQLEKTICTMMDENNISTVELRDGSNLNYQIKESLALTKEKGKTKKEKEEKN